METTELLNTKFAIYERISTEDSPIIDEILDSSLYPDVKVSIKGDNVMILGHLLLIVGHGKTLDTPDFIHKIPVEIAIPKERVRFPENVVMDIEKLNVESPNPVSLNLTGVLVIREEDKPSLVPQEVSDAMEGYLTLGELALVNKKDHPNHVILTDWSFMLTNGDSYFSILHDHFVAHPVEYVKAAMLK